MAKTKSPPVVHHTARCFFSEGQCVLMAYDVDDKEIMGIRCHPRGSTYRWATGGSKAGDLRRMKKEVAETLGSS